MPVERTPRSPTPVALPTSTTGRRVQTHRAQGPFVPYTPPKRPGEPIRPASDIWLLNPAWVDGAVNPPQRYFSDAEIRVTRRMHWDRIVALGAVRDDDFLNGPAARPAGQDPLQQSQLQPEVHGLQPRPQPQMPTQVRMQPVPRAPTSEQLPRETDAATAQDLQPAAAGHLVTVTLLRVHPERIVQRSGSSKIVEKPDPVSKIATIVLLNMTRAMFVNAILNAHGIGHRYNAGVHSGPRFRMWWTGINKTSAGTIDTNEEFSVALDAILKKRGASVFAEIEAKTLEPFCTNVESLPAPGAAHQAHAESHAPAGNVEEFSNNDRMHGKIILALQARWKCKDHHNENGDFGHCYVDGDIHLGLNTRRISMWAASVAAWKSTIEAPPHELVFDGPQTGMSSGVKARGRTGPRPVQPNVGQAVAGPSDGGVGALMPVLTTLCATTLANSLSRMSHHRSPSPVSHRRPPSPASSPPPPSVSDAGQQLHDCLVAFRDNRKIDLLVHEAALAKVDFTPDILPDVGVSRLCEVTGGIEGQMLKLQKFAKEWYRAQGKRRYA